MIPPGQSGTFVAAMEEVLDVYKRPYTRENPVVCIDEMPKQLIQENRREFTDSKGVVHYDTEYVRNGTTNVFMRSEEGRRTFLWQWSHWLGKDLPG